jgi:hypothetical protein
MTTYSTNNNLQQDTQYNQCSFNNDDDDYNLLNIYNHIHNKADNTKDDNTKADNTKADNTQNYYKYNESTIDENIILDNVYNECSLCLEDLVKEVAVLTCNHDYHVNCFMLWVNKCNMAKKDITCPQCISTNCEIILITNKDNNYFREYGQYYLPNSIHNIDTRIVDTRIVDTRRVDTRRVDTNRVDTNRVDNRVVDTSEGNGGRKSVWKRFIQWVKC